MPRNNPKLLQNVNKPIKGDWQRTNGFIYSVDACLEENATAAIVDFYASNSGHGRGVKIATISLSGDSPSDGATLSAEDQGWYFVRAELVSNSGYLRSATACTEN